MVLAVAVAVAGGAACSRDGGPQDGDRAGISDPPSATEGETPSGFRRVAVEDEGFSVAIPEDWKDVPLSLEELELFRRANPEIARLVGDDPGAFIEHTEFFAYEPDGTGSNINVIKSDSAGTVDDLVPGLRELLVDQLGAREVQVERVEMPAGPAARAAYALALNLPDGGTAEVTQVQYHFVSGEVNYVLTFTLFGSFVGEDLPAQVAETFRLP